MRITTEAFTKMITVLADDDYSQQAIVITPAEARQLRDLLNAADLDSSPAQDREAGNLRLLTLYNGHALPAIDRPSMENHLSLIGARFQFELWQVLQSGERRQIGEL